MGIKIASAAEYEASLRKLFPVGEYWDKQFADDGSDCALFVRAKLAEFVHFRQRMSDLFDESLPQTAAELIGDWERILLGEVHPKLDIGTRRELLQEQRDAKVNRAVLDECAAKYGATITGMAFPFRPAFCGFSRCGIDRAAIPAAFSVLRIDCVLPDTSVQTAFEAEITSRLLANHIVYFIYSEVS
jgi:uncharacterized protein YmfQ (DUF2313 family)